MITQESAEGIGEHDVGKASEALQSERRSNRYAEPGTMLKGLNDWERQVGLTSHERTAAEHPARAGSGTGRDG
jgi:hypothetical protein